MKRGSVFRIPHIQEAIRWLRVLFAQAMLKPGTWIHFDIPSQDDNK